jgi:hypothetical protein
VSACARGAAIALAIVAAAARPAAAQSAALAEQLFSEARELGKAGRWREACPKFEASLRHDPQLGTQLNLATCYEQIGKLASAWALYRGAIELARRAGDRARGAYASTRADGLEPRLPRLRIVAPPVAPAGLVVRRGGTVLGPAELGVALYLDPGEHEVVAEAPGFVSFVRTISVIERASEAVEIPPLVAAPPDRPAVVALEPRGTLRPPAAPPAPPVRSRYLGLGVGGAGLLAVGAGLAFGARARATYRDAQGLCGEELRCAAATLAEGTRLVADARTSARVATGLVIGGGAVTVAGVALLLRSRASGERAGRSSVAAAPSLIPGGAGAVVTGRF